MTIGSHLLLFEILLESPKNIIVGSNDFSNVINTFLVPIFSTISKIKDKG